MTNETNTTPAQLINILEGVIATLKKVDALETQVALVHSIVRAQEENNNQLAEIAFDENKFTQALMDKVEEVARETAKDVVEDAVDMDEISSHVQDNIDVFEDVRRVIDRMDLVSEDKVNDLVEEYVNDNSVMTSNEVDNSIESYLYNNDYIQRDDVEDVVRDVVNEVVDERTENIARRIAKEEIVKVIHQMMHAVAGTPQLIKENDHANNDRDTSLHISGTNGQGEAESHAQPNA